MPSAHSTPLLWFLLNLELPQRPSYDQLNLQKSKIFSNAISWPDAKRMERIVVMEIHL